MNAPQLKLIAADFFERPVTLRLPFRFGAVTLTECPQVFVRARIKLAEMPRNSSPTRTRNRCELTGRARGYYRKLRMCRNQLRDLASQGLIPGMTKSSW